MSYEFKYLEDKLILAGWLRSILSRHSVERFTLKMHQRTRNRLEFDVIIRDLDHGKTIAVELKDSDLLRVMGQAIRRTGMFDYVYAAVDLPTHMILGLLRGYSELLDHGVGIASARDDIIVIPAYSNRYKEEATRYKSLLRYIPEDLREETANYISTMKKLGLKP